MPLSLKLLFVVPAFALGTAVCSAAIGPDVVASAPHPAGLRDLGALPSLSRMSVAISLPYRHREELERLVESQSDPSSPLYGRFLSKAQFNAYFAPDAGQYARVLAILRMAGFSVRTYENRTLIDASAPVRTVERFFRTDIHRFAQAGAGVRIANVRDATAPEVLRGAISGVAGLENVDRFHTLNHFAPNRVSRSPGTSVPQLAVPGKLFGPDFGYGPTAYIDAYELPVHAATGKNQVVANVIDADFLDSDLAAYLKYFGVYRSGPPTVRVPIDGGPPSGLGSPDSVETTLDVETLVSLAPGSSLYVYEFPDFSNNQYILDAYEQVVVDDFAGTVNSSFGGCEIGAAELGYPQMTDQIALQGAALGITFHASTGDSGNITFGCSSTTVLSPASSPHFMAIGGTSLYLNPSTDKVVHEFGWGGSGQFGATGGGVSVVFPLPRYQNGVSGVISTGRNIPDLSLDADPGTGESFYYAGAFQGPIGGTSLSSPIFGAAQTLLNELAGREAGFVNPAYYRTLAQHGYGNGASLLFRDIIVGSNGFYQAHPGYDQMTGIGAPIIGNLHPFVR
jgi:subtilase family serine protease